VKNIIKNFTLVGMMAVLAACGGSDTPIADQNVTLDPDTPDKVIPVVNLGTPDANVGLGYGAEADFQTGIAFAAITELSSGGSTSVTVNMVDLDDGFKIYLGQRVVTFNSYCAQLGLAEFNPAQVDASGLALSNYQDKGCGREDNVFVSIVESAGTTDGGDEIFNVVATATTKIDVKQPVVGVVKFIAAEPSSIALKGVGSNILPEISEVSFKVSDRSGNPMFSKEVTFELDHIIGGVSLSRTSGVTNIEGLVSVQLLSGRVNGTVRISATVPVGDENGEPTGELMSTQSNPIGMKTGLPDQNSFSLSADIFNPQGWDVNGARVNITAHLADHYQNPVPDGTVVAFAAEGGSVEGTCETFNGGCSVAWKSQNPRPVDGIVTVVARTVGEGDFQDLNSNGLYDIDEPFISYAEVFIDANGSRVFDKEAIYNANVNIDGTGGNEFLWAANTVNFFEEFFDFNNNGQWDDVGATTKYQGVMCSELALAAGHCEHLVDVSASLELVMSEGRNPNMEGPWLYNPVTGRHDIDVACIDTSNVQRSIMWRLSDSTGRRNRLVNGSKVSFAHDGWIDVISGGNAETIGNYGAPLRYDLWAQYQDEDTDPAQLKYDYLNYRGHYYVLEVAYDDSFIGIYDEIATLALNLDSGGKKIDSGLQISAIGKVYASVLKASDQVGGDDQAVASIDVSAGAATYKVKVVTPCGNGLETGAVVSVTAANGILSDWSSDESVTQEATTTGTFVVTEDRRVGGNIISFKVTADAAPSLDNLSVIVRNGQARQTTIEKLTTIQD
jgi:hypothetical protein